MTTDLRTPQSAPAIRELGKLRATVLAVFASMSVPMTTRQAARISGLDLLTLRPRVTELKDRGDLVAVAYDKRSREWFYSIRAAAPGLHDEVMDVPSSPDNLTDAQPAP